MPEWLPHETEYSLDGFITQDCSATGGLTAQMSCCLIYTKSEIACQLAAEADSQVE